MDNEDTVSASVCSSSRMIRRGPRDRHMASAASSLLGRCHRVGPRPDALPRLPPKGMRCTVCSRASWRTWRIP